MTDSSKSDTSTPLVLSPMSTGLSNVSAPTTVSSSSTSPPQLSSINTSIDAASTAAKKKARRQTAFYPNKNSSTANPHPFSRSAAKRESVMALGSIEHLQHYFTKTGIAAKKEKLHETMAKLHGNWVPAIGPNVKSHVRGNSSLNSITELALPPSPVVPVRPEFPSFAKSYLYETDPESLLPGVIDDLGTVSHIWKISPDPNSTDTDSKPVDVLDTLKVTTRAIRSVRNYLVALPDESTGSLRAQFRSKLISSSSHTPFRPTSPQPPPTKKAGEGKPEEKGWKEEEDPLSLIRKSALHVLIVLRELEERSRLPLSDDAYDVQSDGGGAASTASPRSREDDLPTVEDVGQMLDVPHMDTDTSVSFTLMEVHGRYGSVPVWEDEEEPFINGDEEDESKKREHWDERLVLGGGWLYKQDVRLEDLVKEQEAVKGYLDAVDEVLFQGRKDGDGKGKRGWEREREKIELREGKGSIRAKGRRVSSADGIFAAPANQDKAKRRVTSMGLMESLKGMQLTEEPGEMGTLHEEQEGDYPIEEDNSMAWTEGDESINDDDLPEWARRSAFIDDELGRIHAILSYHLPEHLRSILPPSSPAEPFLASLTSGQLLCVAYNACVRRSRKPWGYINKDGIHDIITLERTTEESTVEGKGWTFRRIDNLRLWAAALKLRYSLPIIFPSLSGTSTAGSGNTPVPSPSPNVQRFARIEQPIFFDAKVVAKKDDGSNDMLSSVLRRWVDKVVEERRLDDR